MKKTLFLNPPSFEGFDGGAGSRYQARREVRSFWYPTWLAQPAACVPGSLLIDAPPDDVTVDDVVRRAEGCELGVIYTSTPSFENDLAVAETLKRCYPNMMLGMVGAHTAVMPEESLEKGRGILSFVARKEFDFTIRDIAKGKPFAEVDGISYLDADGKVVHNPEREIIHDMDSLPSVIDVYKRDLTVENYAIGYLQHPYLSLYTGRGCPAQCTFCLWPQTIGGHRYRTRSPESVYEEIKQAQKLFPQVKEFFFDDDTFTADRPRAEAIAKLLGPLGVTWSCNSRANVPYETLKVMKDNGLRLLLTGFESGNDRILRNIKKGVMLDRARRYMVDCKKLGILVHGTFILGLPGETPETIRESINFAKEIDPYSIQVSLAAPYPGTELYSQAVENKWLVPDDLVTLDGAQDFPLQYPGLSRKLVFDNVEVFYKEFYFRPKPIIRMLKEMVKDPLQRRRRLQEGRDFFKFMSQRKKSATAEKELDRRLKRGVCLILNADDFGWSEGTNEAICALHDEGLLTSTSLMVVGAAVAPAVEAALSRPELAVGLHLTLVHGPSLLPRAEVPHLVDARGWFPMRPEIAGVRNTFLPACRRELRRELEAQFRAFADLGIPWSHVDSHLHFHLTPIFFHAALALAQRYPVTGWRVPEDDWRLYRSMDSADARRQWLLALQFALLCGGQRRAVRRTRLVTTDRCLGLFRTGRLTAEYLAALVRALPDGDFELQCHPDTSTDAGRAELAALRSPLFRAALEERGVELVTYATIQREVA